MFNTKRILVPVDHSEISHAAISAALQLASLHGAELWLLRIQEGLDRRLQRSIEADHSGFDVEDDIEADERALVDALEVEYARAAKAGYEFGRVRAHLYVSGGDWLEVAIQLIKDLEIDLVVSGTHGPKGVKGFLLGSMTEQLVSRSTCSVFVVKPQGFPYLRD